MRPAGCGDTVSLTDSLGGATFSGVTFSGGKSTVTATLETAGWQKITATDTTPSDTVAAGTSNGISVTPAALNKFQISAVPNNLTAGNSTTVTFTAEDQFGNAETSYTGPVNLTSSDGQATFGTVVYAGGVGSVSTTLKTSGTQSVTVADHTSTGINATSNTVTVARRRPRTSTSVPFPITSRPAVPRPCPSRPWTRSATR